MVYPRLIPCVLLKNGLIVRSERFETHQVIGNPIQTISRLSSWNVDELFLIDISTEDYHDLRRDDLHVRYQGSSALDVLQEIAKICFMPLSFGGRVRSLEDISRILKAGADKVSLNSAALASPDLVSEAAREFGNQATVVTIDTKRLEDGRYEVFADAGRTATGRDPVDWAREAAGLGAGEIVIQAIHRDGSAEGYDIELVSRIVNAVDVPVIALGGAGRYQDFPPAFEAGVSGAAAANIFNFFELSYGMAKKHCTEAGIRLRESRLESAWSPREPKYAPGDATARIEARLEAARTGNFPAARQNRPTQTVSWCTECVYSSLSATPMAFDENGVCMGCKTAAARSEIPAEEWTRREALLKDLLERYKSRDGMRPDCVIAVSGGKDSWFQTHYIKNVLGYNPLLITYNGNNYTDVGWRNLLRMKEVFDVDHIIYSPRVDVLKKLNRLAFKIMGDMNWHAHVGINTVPVRLAVQLGIPLVIWGEHGYMDLCGQFAMTDFPEMSYRYRLEHFGRGYDWNYFLGLEGLETKDLIAWQYPRDQEMFDLDLRGIYLGNYVDWDANQHTQQMVEDYGFEVSPEPFDRTYRRMSNLDDMHENGVHDYLKYVKFGYGRCTDHCCKDIRSGKLSRGQAIELVNHYDPVRPRDLYRWLDYAGMSEEEFDRIADTFRDPRVWWKDEDGNWQRTRLEP
jgi:imidazoleglycerol phosphate synthase cyclase subunit